MKVWGSWLGITDTKTEGIWLDDAGNPITFENWRTGEPNDYGKGEDCALIYDGGDWNDESCAHNRHFACQFDDQQRPSDRQLCTSLEDTLDDWTRTHMERSKTSILAQSIKAQCSDTWSATKVLVPLGEPMTELQGIWAVDLARIWKEPDFKHMSRHHKVWATGYGEVALFRVVFGTKEIGLVYRHKDKDKRIKIPYTIESRTEKNIVMTVGADRAEQTYTLTMEQQGIRIESDGDGTVWALKLDEK